MTRLPITENQFQERTIARAMARGWLVHHCRPCQRADGSWHTPISGNEGFPDLVLAKPGRVLFRELKTEVGRLTYMQQHWLDVLGGSVWRVNDWDEVEAILDG